VKALVIPYGDLPKYTQEIPDSGPSPAIIQPGYAATNPVEALDNLRAGLHTDGTIQWETQAQLDLATAKAQTQRAQANVGAGDDPDLWEGASRLGLNEDLLGWRGRKWADYVTAIHPELVPSG